MNDNDYTVKRFGLILAKQTQIEGMKVENIHREQCGESMAYDNESFKTMADEIRTISSASKQVLDLM